jgi:hypothetical protein
MPPETTDAVGGELRVSHVWDLPRVAVELGANAGAEQSPSPS